MGLSPPKELNYINFDNLIREVPNQISNVLLHISLSGRVVKQKRIVYDVFMMFGDVGGLNDFLVLGLSIVFGFFSERYMIADFVAELFQFESKQ